MSTLVATRTVTLNAAFMQEIKEVNGEFWTLLAKARHVCQQPTVRSHNCHQFLNMLLELRDQFALYIALEEAYGYFDDPAEVSSHTAFEVDQLRSEHQQLYSQFSHLIERSEVVLEDRHQSLLESRIPKQFLAFHEQLMVHEHRENELLMAMLDQETGTGD